MSTTLAKPGQIERKWYVLDAAGKPLGRVAAKAAALLRGKGKVIFTPNVDCGDHVIELALCHAYASVYAQGKTFRDTITDSGKYFGR